MILLAGHGLVRFGLLLSKRHKEAIKLSHEGKMRRGKEELARGLDTADTKYYQEQIAAGIPEPGAEQQKKNEKLSLGAKIKAIFQSQKSPEEKLKELAEETKKIEERNNAI